MRVGAIDVGTNSVKLLVAEEGEPRLRTLAQRVVVTRLGGGLKDKIRLEAADRTLRTLADFKEICDRLNCERIVAVGTFALRKARNGREFAQRCEYEAGFPLRIITGEEEARLSFLGATADWPHRPIAAIDIGGGSTELIVGRDGRVRSALSLAMGAVVLTEQYLPSDPPTAAESARAIRALRKSMSAIGDALRDEMNTGGCVVGIGGTAVNAGAMIAARRGRSARLHGLPVEEAELKALLQDLARMTTAQRRLVLGLHPDRADIIVAGLMILTEAVATLGSRRVLISKHGLRRGLILDTIRT